MTAITNDGVEPLHASVAPEEIGQARRALNDWAFGAGLPTRLVEGLVLAAYEAMANAAEHAYPGPGEVGPVNLAASVHVSEQVDVVVSDRGRWRPAPRDPGDRQFGLRLIEDLADAVDIDRSETGTTVRMSWRLSDGH